MMKLSKKRVIDICKVIILLNLGFNYKEIGSKISIISGYGTHQPVLRTVVLNTEGPILELGVGNFSTYLLHDICKTSGRVLLSSESDKEWLNKFKHLETYWHKFIYVSSWNAWDEIGGDMYWSVVFVDHAPANRRVVDIERLRSNTDIFVVHDSEPEANHIYGYEPLLSTFKYRFVYRKLRPETTVVSDTIDITKFFDSSF